MKYIDIYLIIIFNLIVLPNFNSLLLSSSSYYYSKRCNRYESLLLLNIKTKSSRYKSSLLLNIDNKVTNSNSKSIIVTNSNTKNIIDNDIISNNNNNSNSNNKNSSYQDYIILCIVPLIWGTYSPLIKYLYSNANILAPPPLLFNLLSYIVSFSTLSLASSSSSSSLTSVKDNYKPFSTISLLEWQSGIQLGMLLFLGATIQIMGIQGTLATRAAILVQLTTVIVPFIESVVNKKEISLKLWISSFIALIGVIFVSADEFIGNLLINPSFDYNSISNTFSLNTGDLLVCISALFYSCHVVRVSQISNQVSAINLARVKSLTELIASSIAVLISISLSNIDTNIVNNEFSTYIKNAISNPLEYGQIFVLFTVLWNGIFATALTTWAQTTGQRSINAITAQLFYSTQPIWAASLSFLLLGDRVSNVSFIGCLLLLSAILYSQFKNDDNDKTIN